MADEDDRRADASKCANDRIHITFQRIQAVLGGDYLMPFRPQRGDQLLKARAIGPDAVDKYDTRFSHIALLFRLIALTCDARREPGNQAKADRAGKNPTP